MPMFLNPSLRTVFVLTATVILTSAGASAQVYPSALPTNRAGTGIYSHDLLALGEPRFTDARLYNLYDQGGSPMGLLETRKERAWFSLGYLGSDRSAAGDSLTLSHSDLALPHVGFVQPGVFAASLYYMRESSSYRRAGVGVGNASLGGDSVEHNANLFGLDMAAGPASGLFRVGFSAHARMGGLEYSGNTKRVLVSVPSLRFDLGSRPHSAVEIGAFAGFGGRFDSLQSPAGHLERVATMTLPRYGLLADIGGTEDLPTMGNVVIELGTDRMFGEYRPANDSGVQYPIVWTDYWTFQTQWMHPVQVEDFLLQPALRFAHRSEKSQGYAGLKGNQDPFKKGAKIEGMQLTHGITAFGLGGQVGFQEMVSLLVEWETSGHTFKSDTSFDARYNRISLGLEHHVHRLPFEFPEGLSLDLRAGWTSRQEAKERPEFRDFQFDPFLPSPLPDERAQSFTLNPYAPVAYSALTLGFGLGVFEKRLMLDGFIGFPTQSEQNGLNAQDASGMELGLTVTYRLL